MKLIFFYDYFCLLQKIRSNPIDEVVILNADTNEIENPFDDIETLPSDIVSQLYLYAFEELVFHLNLSCREVARRENTWLGLLQ